jgi:ribosomal protein S18 acetylase RimI-like enzyme
MIQRLTSLDGWEAFLEDFRRDPDFSDPHLFTQGQVENNLYYGLTHPEHDRVLGVLQDGQKAGLFSITFSEETLNAEMMTGLSRLPSAYEEFVDYLQGNFPGYHADFVFNPANAPLRELLLRKQAFFYPEQMRMDLRDRQISVDTAGIEALSEQTKAQYLALHNQDLYWTGERVVANPDFHVFVAVDKGLVVGYVDVSAWSDENEIYDLLVMEAHRRKGWGRKLLARAIESNRPKELMLVVDVDNAPAIALYRSLGFETVPGQNSLTATWLIP